MFKRMSTAGIAVVAGAAMVAGVAVAEPAGQCVGEQTSDAQESVQVESPKSQNVVLDTVEGSFAFNQDGLSSKAEIHRALGMAPKYLCDSEASLKDAACPVDSIAVDGTVENSFSLSTEECADHAVSVVLGCSCAGNPAGGGSTVNAEVSGVEFAYIMERAGVSEDANTVVFGTADGYEVAMPLCYVTQRRSLLVFGVNGEPIDETVGSSNQLWLGATAAKYFARDIVSITFEEREVQPPLPYTDEGNEYYGNFPSVGVMSAEA